MHPIICIQDKHYPEYKLVERIYNKEAANYLKNNYINPMKLNSVICLKKCNLHDILQFFKEVKFYASYCNFGGPEDICDTDIYKHNDKKTIIVGMDCESG